MTKTKRLFPAFSVGCSLPGRTVKTKRDAGVFSPVPSLAVSLLQQASISKNDMHTHTQTNMCALCVHATLFHAISYLPITAD